MGALRAYAAAGFDPSGFWDLTPKAYGVIMRGVGDRRSRQEELLRRQAWLIAKLTTAPLGGDLLPFEQIFGESVAAPQTANEMQACLIALAASWGAEMSSDVISQLKQQG